MWTCRGDYMLDKKYIYFGSDFHGSYGVPKARTEDSSKEFIESQKHVLKAISNVVGECLYVDCGDMIDAGKGYRAQVVVNMLVDGMPKNTVFISGNHCQKGFSQNLQRALKEGTLGNLARSTKLHFMADDTTFEWGDYVLHPFNFHAGKTIGHRDVDTTKINVAVGHFLSYDADELPFFIGAAKGWLAKDISREYSEYDLIAVGDHHVSFNINNKYLSPGSLTRRSSNQMKHQPCVWRYDGTTLEPIYLDLPDAKEVLSDEHVVEAKADTERAETFLSSVEHLGSLQGLSLDIKEGLDKYYRSSNELRDGTQPYIQDCIDRIEGAQK